MQHRRKRLAAGAVTAVVVAACQASPPTASDAMRRAGVVGALHASNASSPGQEKKCSPVAISAPGQTIAVGGTVQLTAHPLDKHGKALKKATVTWSSLTVNVAAVSSTGLVTGVSPGNAVIRADCSGSPGFGTLGIAVQ
jgi:hypothetical protein